MKGICSIIILVMAVHSQCAASCLDAYLNSLQKPACHHDGAPSSGEDESHRGSDACGGDSSALAFKVLPAQKITLEWAASEFIPPSAVQQGVSTPTSAVYKFLPSDPPPGPHTSILRI